MGILDFPPGEWPGVLGSSAGRPQPGGPVAPLFVPPTEAAYGEPTPGELWNTNPSPLGKALGGMMDDFAARLAAARSRAMAPEAADHGLSERQKLSPLQRALSPITSYPETFMRMNQEASDQVSHGFDQLNSPETYTWDTPATGSEFDTVAPRGLTNFEKGLGNMALGSLGYVGSPISAAYRSLLGQPVEDLTGIPREWTEFAAQLATPGLGLPKIAGKLPLGAPRLVGNGPMGIASREALASQELAAKLPGAVGPATEAAVATGGKGVVPAAGMEASAPKGPNAPLGFASLKTPITQESPGKLPQPVSPITKAAASANDGSGILPTARTEPSALNGPMPQLAYRYPKTAPPVLKFDEEKGKWYLAKRLSQEELDLKALRIAAQRDIDAGNYTPMFDPAERDYPDRTYYPPATDTRNIKAARAATQQKHEDIARDPAATQRLDDAFARGHLQEENARDWAAMGQLENEFIKEYGADEGRKQFKGWADSVAATSAGADPRANLMMAHYGNFLKTQGETIPTESDQIPYPVGSRFVGPNMQQYRKMIMEGGGITPANPKRYDYANSFLGHNSGFRKGGIGDNGGPPLEDDLGFDSGPPIDEQRFRLMDPSRSAPPPGTYGHYKGAVVDRAGAHGVSPTYYGDMVYAGARENHQTKPMIVHVNEMIERVHRITGMPKLEVLRGLIRGNIPMFGLAGIPAAKQLSTDDDGN
jgi:hypothetical protein